MPRLALLITITLLVHLGQAHADAVTEWNELATITHDASSAAHAEAPSDPWSPKMEAEEIVAVAIFQAVNTVSPHYAPFRKGLAGPATKASTEAAAVAAAHAALVSMFPERKSALDDAYALTLDQIPESPARTAGVAVGVRAAAQIIAWRTEDHATPVPPLRPAAPAGSWVPTLPTTIPPFYAVAKPWLMTSAAQFRPPPPVSLASATWARDFNETRTLGGRNSSARPPQWTRLATFYSMWRQMPLVHQIAALPGRTLEQNARLYALTAMVVADAEAAMVDGKLTYSFWRPITAIRNGDQDGNDATARQADWEPLLVTPMHPEYPCGHCVAIRSLVTVLEADARVPAGGLAVTSDVMPGVVHRVASYSALADEISLSRIYAGAHFRSSTEMAQTLGRQVADYALRSFLQPLR